MLLLSPNRRALMDLDLNPDVVLDNALDLPTAEFHSFDG
jgi:hypothetical protein